MKEPVRWYHVVIAIALVFICSIEDISFDDTDTAEVSTTQVR